MPSAQRRGLFLFLRMTIKTAADAEYADDLGKIFSGSVYSGHSRRYPGGLGMDRRVEALDFSRDQRHKKNWAFSPGAFAGAGKSKSQKHRAYPASSVVLI